MFAVLLENEDGIELAFTTADRAEAHRVFEAASKQENEVRIAGEMEPGQVTLTDCLTDGDEFLRRQKEALEEFGEQR